MIHVVIFKVYRGLPLTRRLFQASASLDSQNSVTEESSSTTAHSTKPDDERPSRDTHTIKSATEVCYE